MQSPLAGRPESSAPAINAPSMPQVADQCFKDLEGAVGDTGQVPDADLIKLSLLLGRNWPKALQLVEQGAVRCFQGDTSGRRVFQVHGKSSQHTTLPRHYCSCQAHHYEVVIKADTPYCKHQLAARLAWILKACPVTPVDDEMIANMLLET